MTLPADWIYLFTSNARALYSVDALNALGLPRGWVLHYRYDKKHVEERLWESLVSKDDTPGALKGKQLVVSLVNQKQVKSDDKVSFEATEYFPLRTGELVEYRIDGRVVHFWFALQAYLRYERSGQAGGLPWQVQNRVQAACGEKTALLGVYATWGNPEPFAGGGVISDADATSGFQSTVEAISDHGFRSGSTIFARFHGLTERTPGPTQTDRVVAIGYDEGTQESKYVLEEGKTYRLAVTIYSEKFLSLPTFAGCCFGTSFRLVSFYRTRSGPHPNCQGESICRLFWSLQERSLKRRLLFYGSIQLQASPGKKRPKRQPRNFSTSSEAATGRFPLKCRRTRKPSSFG